MITKITGEQPFQVLTNNFSISPSNEGYTLQISADGKNYSNLFTVGAGVTRLVTGVAANSFYRLSGNQSQVSINWMKTCVTEGGSGGSGTELSPVTEFPLEAEAGTVVAYNGTASASGVYQYTGEEWVPVGVDDLSDYWTSAQTEDAISAATAGKADAANVQTYGDYRYFPKWNEQGIITDKIGSTVFESSFPINNVSPGITVLRAGWDRPLPHIYAPTTSGNPGEILVSTGNDAPVWSAMTFPTPDVDKAYVDSAITGVQDQIDIMDEVVATSLVDLNDRIVELSGSSVDLSAYYTSAQTDSAISAATSGKADAANISKNTGYMCFPKWNEQGIITGPYTTAWTPSYFYINGVRKEPIFARQVDTQGRINFYIPESAGTAGDILVSTGSGAPVWSAVTFSGGGVSQEYVDSGDTNLQNQIDIMDEVVSDALNDLNGQMASKVSSASVSTIWRGTQAEYNAIATKDPATLYIIL